jgi:hypothetical protein
MSRKMRYFEIFFLICMVLLFISGCTIKEQVHVDIDSFIKGQAWILICPEYFTAGLSILADDNYDIKKPPH